MYICRGADRGLGLFNILKAAWPQTGISAVIFPLKGTGTRDLIWLKVASLERS